MEQITLELEAITPVFIAGADQRNIENEGLRAPSLRGLMRWWFRAVAGGMVSSYSALMKKESEIFGSTAKKSKVIVISIPQNQPENIKEQEHQWFTDPGKSYLWFSIKRQQKKNKRLQYYKEGAKFNIILRSGDMQALKVAAGTIWLLVYLGSVGSRNRRGAGCLKVNKCSTNIDLPFTFNHNLVNIGEVKKYLEDSLTAIFDLFKNYIGKEYMPPRESPNYCVLPHAKIALISQGTSPLDILENMGEKYSEYRKKVPIQQRDVLGLPLRNIKDRFSSPLIFGVIALKNGYVGRIVKFYSSTKKASKRETLKNHLDKIDSSFSETNVSIPVVK